MLFLPQFERKVTVKGSFLLCSFSAFSVLPFLPPPSALALLLADNCWGGRCWSYPMHQHPWADVWPAVLYKKKERKKKRSNTVCLKQMHLHIVGENWWASATWALNGKWVIKRYLGWMRIEKQFLPLAPSRQVGTRDFLEAMQFSRQQERLLELKQRAAG